MFPADVERLPVGNVFVNETITIPYGAVEKYVLAARIADTYLPVVGTEGVKHYTLRKVLEKQFMPHSGKKYQTKWLLPLLRKLSSSTTVEDVEEVLLVEYRKVIPTLSNVRYVTKRIPLDKVKTTATKHLERITPLAGSFDENRIAGLVIKKSAYYFLVDGHHRYKTLLVSNKKSAFYIIAHTEGDTLRGATLHAPAVTMRMP